LELCFYALHNCIVLLISFCVALFYFVLFHWLAWVRRNSLSACFVVCFSSTKGVHGCVANRTNYTLKEFFVDSLNSFEIKSINDLLLFGEPVRVSLYNEAVESSQEVDYCALLL